jgi:hypothetical protein
VGVDRAPGRAVGDGVRVPHPALGEEGAEERGAHLLEGDDVGVDRVEMGDQG